MGLLPKGFKIRKEDYSVVRNIHRHSDPHPLHHHVLSHTHILIYNHMSTHIIVSSHSYAIHTSLCIHIHASLTHIHTEPHSHSLTHMNTGAFTCVHPYTNITHRATHSCTCMDICVCTYEYKYTIHSCTRVHVWTHILAHIHAHSTQSWMYALTYSCTCVSTHLCPSLSGAHTLMHTCRLLHILQCSHLQTAYSYSCCAPVDTHMAYAQTALPSHSRQAA